MIDMNIFDAILPKFTESIFGIALDLTTVIVGILIVVFIIFGLDLVIRVLFVSPDSESSDVKEYSKDREAGYDKYARERYWRGLYKDRYERNRHGSEYN